MDEFTKIIIEESILAALPEGTKIRYFYTEDRPYMPTSGPTMTHLDPGKQFYEEIVSLERAKEIAEEKSRGKRGHESCVDTTFGLEIILPETKSF